MKKTILIIGMIVAMFSIGCKKEEIEPILINEHLITDTIPSLITDTLIDDGIDTVRFLLLTDLDMDYWDWASMVDDTSYILDGWGNEYSEWNDLSVELQEGETINISWMNRFSDYKVELYIDNILDTTYNSYYDSSMISGERFALSLSYKNQ